MRARCRLRSSAALFLTNVVLATAPAAGAQGGPATTTHEAEPAQSAVPARITEGDDLHLDDIVVTGRLGNEAQKKVEASYSVTTLTDTDLRERAITNLANALQTVPGIWADDSAGVTANNTRVRGIPRGGFEALAVYEDGLPVQHDPGINWINVDQFVRIDETYAAIEAVRGGPSSIFASNAPGGLINFLPRRGTPELSGLVKLTTADYGQARGDVWVGGPIADGWRFSAGGYYNWDRGVRDPGPVANNGGQGRILVSKEFGRGNLSFGVKYMEDNNFFFDGLPLVRTPDGDVEELPGIDARYDTLTGRQVGRVIIRTPVGIRRPRFNLFNQSSDLQFTVKGDIRLDDATTLSGGFRYRDSKTDRNARGLNNLTTPTAYLNEVVVNNPRTTRREQALAAFRARGATDVRFVYNDDGSAFPANANGNGFVGVNTFQSIQNPIKESIGLIELGRVFDTGWGRHDVKLGIYGTVADWSHDRNDGVGLTEVADNARLLDVVALNAAGQVVGRLTDTGIARYESRFANSFGGYDDVAAYVSDEWQVTGRLRVDAGFRWEKIWIRGYSEGVRSFNLGDPDTLADDNVLFGNGVFTRFDEPFDDHAYTVGANWQIMPQFGVFARYTNTYRLPQIGQYRDNVLPTGVRSQSIEQAEGGVKFQSGPVSAFATVFYNGFADVQFTNTFIDPQTLRIVQEINFGDVRTTGVELEGSFRPARFFDIAGTFTFQDPKFDNYTYRTAFTPAPTPANPNPQPQLRETSFDGNRPGSMPRVFSSLRPQLRLFGDRLRILGEWRYEGSKFNDDANIQRLPSFSVYNATVDLDATPNLTFQVKGLNLSNTLGLGQGGGQQQVPAALAGNIIVARPIFGRSVVGSALLRF